MSFHTLSPATQRQISACIRSAQSRFGPGWKLLGAALREALVAREVLAMLAAREGTPGGSWDAAAKIADAGLQALDPIDLSSKGA